MGTVISFMHIYSLIMLFAIDFVQTVPVNLTFTSDLATPGSADHPNSNISAVQKNDHFEQNNAIKSEIAHPSVDIASGMTGGSTRAESSSLAVQNVSSDSPGEMLAERSSLILSKSETVVAPLPTTSISTGSASSLILLEYGYDLFHQSIILHPIARVVGSKRLFGFRKGPLYAFGMYLDVPPWYGFGLFRAGSGVNVLADLLALLAVTEGRKTIASGLKNLPPNPL